MKTQNNKFNLMATEKISTGMSLADLVAVIYGIDRNTRITIPEIGSKLKIKVGRKIVLRKISRGTKNGENRLIANDIILLFNEKNANLKIFFGNQVITNARIENDRVVLEM